MKLNGETKAGLILALASISKSLEVSQIKLPKHNNTTIYTIKNSNGDLDITLNFQGRPKVDNEFLEIVEYLRNYEFTTESSGKDDESLLSTTCEIFNIYNDLSYQLRALNDRSYIDRLSTSAGILADWWDKSNITNTEAKVLSGACKAIATIQKGNEIYPQDLLDGIRLEHLGFSEYLKDYSNEMAASWSKRKKEKITDDQIKEEIRLLTMATSTKLVPCIFCTATGYNNTTSFKYGPTTQEVADFLGMEKDYIHHFHDREDMDKDLNTFKKRLYSILLASFQNIEQPIKTMEEADGYDNLVCENISDMFNDYAFERACNLYSEIYHVLNPHAQKVVEGTLLNHASLRELPIKGLPRLNVADISYERIGDITEINYENLSNRKLFYEVFKAGITSDRNKFLKTAEAIMETREDSEDTAEEVEDIEDYLKRLEDTYENPENYEDDYDENDPEYY